MTSGGRGEATNRSISSFPDANHFYFVPHGRPEGREPAYVPGKKCTRTEKKCDAPEEIGSKQRPGREFQ